MRINNKTYKTKEVNIVRLSVFYEEITSKLKDTKKYKNGSTNISINTSSTGK